MNKSIRSQNSSLGQALISALEDAKERGLVTLACSPDASAIAIQNRKTLKTFQKTNAKKGLVRCKNSKDMFKKLGLNDDQR